MMSRITNGVPLWEIALSLGILFISFILMTWLAGRIYRTGILMYGKKTSWREIGKWLFYK
jgi:ABC-2 type transport system permease protein